MLDTQTITNLMGFADPIILILSCAISILLCEDVGHGDRQ